MFFCLEALLRKYGSENQNREQSYAIKLGHFMALDSMVQFLNFYFNVFYFLQLERI